MNENRKIRNELWKSVDGLTDEQLNRRVSEESWSIMQVLEHLYLMEKGIVANMKKALTEEDHPTDPKPIQLTLNRSTKIPAPSYFVPTNDFITLAEMKTKLEDSRANLTAVEETADTRLFEKKSFLHPVFGQMTVKQWIPFIGLHEKRHLAQIEEIKQVLGY
ncbi:DinB family protein [Heyndrickxia vini]|uniref:DinB family protein n=1 Tax=Heyndrickxia vini TaxID=1476025 RepID=A0ABX7E260_9BACI|nr:DinB family protein [Heyndrickxia vini]QQZ08877.1 DinB family protein [Heyndrickxia vini]